MKRTTKQIAKLLMVFFTATILSYILHIKEYVPALFSGAYLMGFAAIVFGIVVAVVGLAHTKLEDITQKVRLNVDDEDKIKSILQVLTNLNYEMREDAAVCSLGMCLCLVLSPLKNVFPSPLLLGSFRVDVSGIICSTIFGILVSVVLATLDLLLAFIHLLGFSSYT